MRVSFFHEPLSLFTFTRFAGSLGWAVVVVFFPSARHGFTPHRKFPEKFGGVFAAGGGISGRLFKNIGWARWGAVGGAVGAQEWRAGVFLEGYAGGERGVLATVSAVTIPEKHLQLGVRMRV